jgi:hypothetical protein
LLLLLGSCRLIAGLHDVHYVAADAACATPTLPTAGAGRVRLVNAGTQGTTADFCIRVSGTSDWGTPILAAGSASCDAGLPYAQATVPFAVEAGAIDVEAIPAGSGCDAAPTSQASGVAIGDSTAGAPVVTLVRFGAAQPEQIAALPEESVAAGAQDYDLRLVNALSSGQSITMGFSASASLPTTVAAPLLAVPIAPGAVEPPPGTQPLPVDDAGYVHFPATGLPVGVVLDGHHDALFAMETPSRFDVVTLFALGDITDGSHPVRGLLCEDSAQGSAGVLAACQLTGLATLDVDTLNTTLYGANAPFNDQRRSAVYAAVAARPSDLMCLQETAMDYDAIVQAAKSHFPYSYFVHTDLDTQPTDPTDAAGNTPPPPSGPPCGGLDPSIVDAIYQCSMQCTDTGDLTGRIATTNCLSTNCAGQYLELYQQGPQQSACYDCILYYATSELPLTDGKTACTTDPRQPFSYDGMNGTLMLSRYPLSHTQAFILPGTGFRRAVLYAQVALEDQTVDFFCAQLMAPGVDNRLPYVGNYGTDVPNQENGWEDEQDLQARKTVAWIKSTATHPAIIAGDWYSTSQVTATGADGGPTIVLASFAAEVLAMLDESLGGAFVRAEPPGYVPACDQCPAPQCVYNASNSPPLDETPTFLAGFPASATLEDSLWGMENTVPLSSIPDEPAPAAFGPISGNYGRLVRIARPPVP